jgi:hypothetical protein
MSTVRIQVRRGTSEQWEDIDPTLAAGEMGVETDTNKIKVGTGNTVWTSLPYLNIVPSDLENTLGDYVELADVGNAGGPAKLDVDGNLLIPKSSIILEGSSADDYETTLTVTNPTADRTITFPNASGTVVLSDDSGNVTVSGNLTIEGTTTTVNSTQVNIQNAFVFEGATANDFETTLTTIDPTEDRTISLPNASGTIALTSDIAELSQDAIDSALSFDVGMNKFYNDETNTIQIGVDPNIFATVDNLDTQIAGIQEQIDTEIPGIYAPLISPLLTDASFTGSVTGLTKGMVGLEDVDNTPDLQKPVSDATQDALDLKAPLDSPIFTGTVTGITKTMVSLGNVDDTSDLDKPISSATQSALNNKLDSFTAAATYATQTELNNKLDSSTASTTYATIASPEFTGTVTGITKTMVGLGNVDNTSDGDKPISSATQSELNNKLDSSTASTTYATIASPEFTGTVTGITKTMVGLGNVDDTSDINKPVSTAMQTELDSKVSLSGGTLTGFLLTHSDPTLASHVANKQYVDNTASGLVAKPQVLGATTQNIDATYNNGTAGVGATLTHNTNGEFPAEAGGASGWAVGKGILVKNQTNKAQNGRYFISNMGSVSTPYVLTRCGYCDEASEIPGAYIFVQDGTNAGTGWIQVVADPSTFVVGTDDIDVFQFSGAGTITAGTNISVNGNEVSVVSTPSLSGITFSDGTQTKEGVPSRTPIISKTDNYTLAALSERDSLIEVNSTDPITITVPTNSAVAYPIGTTLDILGINTGLITIAGDTGVTVNATPGLKLRTQWSSCTLLKRAENSWVVYGDLKA